MKFLIAIILLLFFNSCFAQVLPETPRSKKAIEENEQHVLTELQEKGLELGSPIFMRIFKEEKELEVWVMEDSLYKHFKTYEICYYSGGLGRKKRQGDGISPEGFYFVNAKRLNPWSSFHLSFNLGYPNVLERSLGYTGNYLMIHGNCVSIGCYAMTDPVIEELFTLGHFALKKGQPFFRVHAFPFRMTESKMQFYQDDQSIEFWRNLKEGYDLFEKYRVPPNVIAKEGKYAFNYDL